MKNGHFYFITDDFYLKYDKQQKLMQNKEVANGTAHHRPCFYAFPDKKNPEILWCVPISSKVQKFENIAITKINNQKNRGFLNPKCNTIRFGNILGMKRAFLIQNMFPVTKKYVSGEYIDKNTNKPVTIDPVTEKDILNNAQDVLKLVKRGFSKLVFSDILQTRSDLIAELQHQIAAPTPEQQQS